MAEEPNTQLKVSETDSSTERQKSVSTSSSMFSSFNTPMIIHIATELIAMSAMYWFINRKITTNNLETVNAISVLNEKIDYLQTVVNSMRKPRASKPNPQLPPPQSLQQSPIKIEPVMENLILDEELEDEISELNNDDDDIPEQPVKKIIGKMSCRDPTGA